MTVIESGAGTGLVARVKGILLSPSEEWRKIAQEPATVGGLYVGYVCLLAAIPAVAGLVGGLMFGHGALGITVRPSIPMAITSAITTYLGALLMTFVLGMVIDALAPNFGAEKNRVQAFKVAAYSGTASWVAGVLYLVPALSIVVLLASLYGCYLLYLGLPRVMKAPEDKATGYAVVTIIIAIVAAFVIGMVSVAITGAFGMGKNLAATAMGGATAASGAGGSVEINGQKIDLGRIEEANRRAEAASKGDIKPVAIDDLKALLPADVSGYARESVEATSTGAAGMNLSTAKGEYNGNGSTFSLEVTDLGPMAGMAALAGAMGAQSSHETATGYEKVETRNGRLTTESWDREAKSGRYSIVVADRFSVTAEGGAGGVDDLKRAVAAIDVGRLEALAK